MFKQNPKQLAENKVRQLFCGGKSRFDPRAKVKVTGGRTDHDVIVGGSVAKRGTYLVEASLAGVMLAHAHHHSWRKAYKLLVIEIEKAYEASLSSPEGAATC